MAFPMDALWGLGLPGLIITVLAWVVKIVVTRFITDNDKQKEILIRDRDERLAGKVREIERLQKDNERLHSEVRAQLEKRIDREQVVNNQLSEQTQQTQLVAVKLGDNSAKALAVVHELMKE